MSKTIRHHLKDTASSLIKYFVSVILAGLAIIYLLSGIYKVSESELGVIQRFGKVIDGKVEPGGHYRLPWPIDTVTKVPVKTTHSMDIIDFSLKQASDEKNEFRDITGLSIYCITGDNNIVFIDFVIRYNIVDPVKYLFNINSSEDFLKHTACAAVINSLAGKTVDDILTVGKKSVEVYLKKEIQENLDSLNSGLGINDIEIKDVSPIKAVRDYFERVINAQIQKRELINNAESYRNQNIPKTKGMAMQITEEAWGYRTQVISHAQGDADRFKQQLNEYSKAKEITKQRMYLDFIQQKFPELEKIILVDNTGKKRVINLRLLSN
ncbi:MAG: FtsH protease activity modulator HflK [Desulfatiglans sp.]|jgi:membrane protease subunit HflK|nr:FtsH protease activity modulator HflK [Desulfatiglans sp.]